MRSLFRRCVLFCIAEPLLECLYRWAVRSSTIDHYGTIGLSDSGSKDAASSEFVVLTRQALRLVEETDGRRYRRIQRHLHYIVNSRLLTAARYEHGGWCEVDIERYRGGPGRRSEEWRAACLACTLVHEATHGRVRAHGIRTSERSWVRIERLCHREAARFAARLQSDRFDFGGVAAQFDEERYRTLYDMPPDEYARALLARYQEGGAPSVRQKDA